MRIILVAALAAFVLVSQTGCAVLLTGYLIGDGIARSEKTKACRQNLQTTNQARLAKGLDPYPDQCG